MIRLPFGGCLRQRRRQWIVHRAQNRTVRHRAQRPLPVIVVRNVAGGRKLHHPQQRAQSDIDVQAAAGKHSQFFAQRRQERRSRNFQRVEAGKQIGSSEVSGGVGEDRERVMRRTRKVRRLRPSGECQMYCAHIRRSHPVAQLPTRGASVRIPQPKLRAYTVSTSPHPLGECRELLYCKRHGRINGLLGNIVVYLDLHFVDARLQIRGLD